MARYRFPSLTDKRKWKGWYCLWIALG